MAATSAAGPVLVQREDRRVSRTSYQGVVLVDGQPAAGRDISASGLSVLLGPTLSPGDIVRLTLAGEAGSGHEVCTSARVSRIETHPEGFVVGLQFIE